METAILLVYSTIISISISTACMTGWFGSTCQYQCHCRDNLCDTNGSCTNGSSCRAEWFGPSCQYQSLLETYTHTYPKYNGHCNVGNIRDENITIRWNITHVFSFMRVVLNLPGIQERIPSIAVIFKSNNDEYNCSHRNVSVIDQTTFELRCVSGQHILFNEIKFQGDVVSRFCSVFVSGGRNVALKQKAMQSSTFDQLKSGPEKAVDGNRNSDYHNASCTHSMVNTSSNWNITLKTPVTVNRFVLYNRVDVTMEYKCCPERLKGFVLLANGSEGNEVFRYAERHREIKKIYSVVLTTPKEISSLNIDLNGNYLTLCEVEIYGDDVCEKGKYGPDCNRTCRCPGGEACFNTGVCPSGCLPGYQGEGCWQECPQKSYGKNCVQKCSTNCSEQKCDRETGNCESCPDGRNGLFCEKDCSKGRYGPMCSRNCSKSCSDQQCDARNGTCFSCNPGFIGDICQEVCSPTFYGLNCSLPCSTSCLDSLCHHVTGSCHNCPKGRMGSLCELKEQALHSTTTAVYTVAVLLTLTLVIFVSVGMWRQRSNVASRCQQGGDHTKQPEPDELDELPLYQAPNSTDDSGSLNVHSTYDLENNTKIYVHELSAFLQTHDLQFFQEQFQRIRVPEMVSMDIGMNEENRIKNRYKNICTYDHSRVLLEINTANNEGDYVNASFIKGFQKEREFIASQGPNKTMVNDFVRMLWEQKVDKVVMLTNLIEENKIKCERYWPIDGKAKFGNITVILSATQVLAHYTIRRLELKKRNAPGQIVVQFHFTAWPDKGVPKSAWTLVDFEQRVHSSPTNRPIVVHCSAGVGRTGTFIALWNIMRQAETTGAMNIFQAVTKLREDRMMMVQTYEQYEFLHRASQIAWLCRETTVRAAEITNRLRMLEYKSTNVLTQMEREFEAVCSITVNKTEVKHESGSCQGETSIYQNNNCLNNVMRSRFPSIQPHPNYVVKLDTEEHEINDFINAVMVPSFNRIDGHILTQLPLQTTVADFWRLVYQCKVSVIVAFELDAMGKDSTIANYLSDRLESNLFVISQGPIKKLDLLEEQVLRIKLGRSRSLKGDQLTLTHFTCSFTDLDPRKLLSFMNHVRTCASKTFGRTLFMCRNGAEFCGLACALSLLLDRMENDQRLAVPLTVGHLKSIRPEVIPTVKQYKVLYQVMDRFNETSSSYSNFGDLTLPAINTARCLERHQNTDNDLNLYANH